MIVVAMGKDDGFGCEFSFKESGANKITLVARVDDDGLGGLFICHQIAIGGQITDS